VRKTNYRKSKIYMCNNAPSDGTAFTLVVPINDCTARMQQVSVLARFVLAGAELMV